MTVLLLTAASLTDHGGGHASVFWDLPPLHPILVNFTAGLIPAALVADLLGRLLAKQSLHHAAWWMLLFAAVITPLTAVAGWWWLTQMPGMDHAQAMGIHKWTGTALAVALVPLIWWRARIHLQGQAPSWKYLASIGLVVAVLVVQAHLGGTMSFGHDHATVQQEPTRGANEHRSTESQHRHDH